ncbi:MAG: 4-hydroxy-3-methylbut-2-enyl diphosphate reductase [Pseudanabaena sp. M158S2SP1A06QC]|jgi:4-hydroxy-3-methylbut-2-enyl diphosphate reductase|nr:4-hydroxy-3-methylbut-2-enyl diphosphate reductase [Pseudanabaena sp. M109S1SP1A06QC]MCA6610703.1 4-hydroxy-3-methylbut-2-enyl diphosphate reductase [Pseudanabaena sp. M158S2SP1A06QC]MCA6614416.1 4-hydroxy-3-methylbut-2-enyl diphosphate reductase [Pseudanabaena sp. M090S1SP1A06QC]MCE2976067.1 4-hydroxy-3-methylbut-2-enyl diphosphate reductase [Pseudanabaena sp. CoA8_M7]
MDNTLDTQAMRRSLQKSPNYFRQGFGHGEAAESTMRSQYHSNLIQTIREHDYIYTQGDVTIYLAKSFGFCWGVERAVAMAYETRTQFPTEKVWITNEIIHNPSVNARLKEMEVQFVPVNSDGTKDFSGIEQGDVVILPAFGASIQETQLFDRLGTKIVDTTCPWVSKVWNRVEKHKKSDFTSIVHGKYNHEETIATSSYANRYLVVLNMKEAEYVANYMLNGGDREEFIAKFSKAMSVDFDPDRDLERVGVANQTTMLKGETEAIGKLFERTMMQKYGVEHLNEHFLAFNTICDATQERQDAMFEIVEEPINLMIVIGGYNSSNTTHLQEIAIERNLPSYHIDDVHRIISAEVIEHKPLGKAIEQATNWLPTGKIKIGVTSGASTPDRVVEDVINRIFELKS